MTFNVSRKKSVKAYFVAVAIIVNLSAAAAMEDECNRLVSFLTSAPSTFVLDHSEVGKKLVTSMISKNLKKAIASGRKFGIELEFAGVSREAALKALQQQLGGKIVGVLRFQKTVSVTTEFSLDFNSRNSSGVNIVSEQFRIKKIEKPNSKKYFLLSPEEKWIEVGSLTSAREVASSLRKKPSEGDEISFRFLSQKKVNSTKKDGEEKLVSTELDHLADGRFLVTMLNDQYYFRNQIEVEAFLKSVENPEKDYFTPNSKILDSKIGTIELKNEYGKKLLDGIQPFESEWDSLEVVTEPLSYDKKKYMKKLLEALTTLGATNEVNGRKLGIHINVDADTKNSVAALKLMNKSVQQGKALRDYFRISPNRIQYAQDEINLVVEKINQTNGDIVDVAKAYVTARKEAGMPDHGKQTWFNVDPLFKNILSNGEEGRPAIEFRLFNSDFDEASLSDQIDFSLSYVESGY